MIQNRCRPGDQQLPNISVTLLADAAKSALSVSGSKLLSARSHTNRASLRRYLPYHHGVPGGRWLTILINRIDPNLFAAAFTAWVLEVWPDKPDYVAIDGKIPRHSHDRSAARAPLHLVSAFAATTRLVPGQEAVADKSNEVTAMPVLIERLAARTASRAHSCRSTPSSRPNPIRTDFRPYGTQQVSGAF